MAPKPPLEAVIPALLEALADSDWAVGTAAGMALGFVAGSALVLPVLRALPNHASVSQSYHLISFC